MGMRKTAIVALIAMAWMGAPIQQGVSFAQGAPAAMATEAMASSLSAADKDALMKKLAGGEEARQNRARRMVAGAVDAGHLRQKNRRNQGPDGQAQERRGFPAERRRQSDGVAEERSVMKFH